MRPLIFLTAFFKALRVKEELGMGDLIFRLPMDKRYIYEKLREHFEDKENGK